MRKIKLIIFVVSMMILMFGTSGQAQKLDGSPKNATDSAQVLMQYFTNWINNALSQENNFFDRAFSSLYNSDTVWPLKFSSVEDVLLWGSIVGKKPNKIVRLDQIRIMPFQFVW